MLMLLFHPYPASSLQGRWINVLWGMRREPLVPVRCSFQELQLQVKELWLLLLCLKQGLLWLPPPSTLAILRSPSRYATFDVMFFLKKMSVHDFQLLRSIFQGMSFETHQSIISPLVCAHWSLLASLNSMGRATISSCCKVSGLLKFVLYS